MVDCCVRLNILGLKDTTKYIFVVAIVVVFVLHFEAKYLFFYLNEFSIKSIRVKSE